MFEGLVPTLQASADRLHDRFEQVTDLLAKVVTNTEGETSREQWRWQSTLFPEVGEEETSEANLRNETGNGWLVEWVACKSGSPYAFLNSTGESGFLDGIEEGNRVKWYVPPGGVLIFTLAGPISKAVTVNVMYRELVESFAPAHTGSSGEKIDTPTRVEPIPSGHPNSIPLEQYSVNGGSDSE